MAEQSKNDPDRFGETDKFPYPDEDDQNRMANSEYDQTKLIVGQTVTRLFQATGVPLSSMSIEVIEIDDTTVKCNVGGIILSFDKETGIAEQGIKYGRLETE